MHHGTTAYKYGHRSLSQPGRDLLCAMRPKDDHRMALNRAVLQSARNHTRVRRLAFHHDAVTRLVDRGADSASRGRLDCLVDAADAMLDAPLQ